MEKLLLVDKFQLAYTSLFLFTRNDKMVHTFPSSVSEYSIKFYEKIEINRHMLLVLRDGRVKIAKNNDLPFFISDIIRVFSQENFFILWVHNAITEAPYIGLRTESGDFIVHTLNFGEEELAITNDYLEKMSKGKKKRIS